MFRVTRRYQFAASHRLHASQLDENQNRRIYGKCNNPFGHGHNYEVSVTAIGPLDPDTGYAVDRAMLDRLVAERVIEAFDHRNLNTEIREFADSVPTSENLAVEICRRLKRGWAEAFPGKWPRLDKIRIAETERNIFEIRADEVE